MGMPSWWYQGRHDQPIKKCACSLLTDSACWWSANFWAAASLRCSSIAFCLERQNASISSFVSDDLLLTITTRKKQKKKSSIQNSTSTQVVNHPSNPPQLQHYFTIEHGTQRETETERTSCRRPSKSDVMNHMIIAHDKRWVDFFTWLSCQWIWRPSSHQRAHGNCFEESEETTQTTI